MDENTAQPQVIYASPTPWYKSKKFIILLFVVILILIPLSFYIFKTYFLKAPVQTLPQQPAQVSSKSTLEESQSPIAFDILQNPMVYEWRGSVEGTLVAKDDKSITISDDKRNKITIIVASSSKEITGTKFYKTEAIPDKDGRRFTEVTIDNIPLGTKLHGDFFVFPHNKNELIGSSFNIVE